MATRRILFTTLAAGRRVRVPVAPYLRWSSTTSTSSSSPTSVPHERSAEQKATAAYTPIANSEPSSSSAPNASDPTTPDPTFSDSPSSIPSSSTAPPPSTPSPEPWTRCGIHPAVAAQLVSAFPTAVAPTPSQRSFLMSVLRGDTDVYLKDYMGRGKTFALAIAAMSLACYGDRQIVMLFPTPHLAQQVSDLLTSLSPEGRTVHTLLGDDLEWEAPIIVTTPRVLNSLDVPELPSLTHVFLDEPDTMFGPLPSRRISEQMLYNHPVNRHPPPVATALNTLLGIDAPKRAFIDFSGRKAHVRTVWASATFTSALRRFVYGRGWVMSSARAGGVSRGVVDLNFTSSASPAQREIVDALKEIGEQGGVEAFDLPEAPKPQHFAFVVGPTGRMQQLQVTEAHPHDRYMEEGKPAPAGDKDGLVQLTLVEAMAFIHATSPPPPGTYALVLPPRSGSLKALAAELTKLGLTVAPLVPEALEGGIPPPDADGTAPVLISSRAAMAGLHLPQLHTVYMLNGVDLAGLSPAQRKLGGRHEREVAYSIIAGRLGRMGTQAASVPGHPQRVISLVSEGSSEETALDDLFAGRLNNFNNVPFELDTWTGVL